MTFLEDAVLDSSESEPCLRTRNAHDIAQSYGACNPMVITCHPSADGEIENWLW